MKPKVSTYIIIAMILASIVMVGMAAKEYKGMEEIEPELPPGSEVRAVVIFDQAYPDMSNQNNNLTIQAYTYYVPVTGTVTSVYNAIQIERSEIYINLSDDKNFNKMIEDHITAEAGSLDFTLNKIYYPTYSSK